MTQLEMASRGKTVEGTDGTDYNFRERIAAHYRESARLKKNLEILHPVLLVPIVLLLIHVTKFCDSINFTGQILPERENWEYLYISSAFFNFLGYTALSRNNIYRLGYYFYGSGATVMGSVIWAAAAHAHEVEAFIMRGKVKSFLFGQPLVIITYVFLALVTQLNILTLNYNRRLLAAWTSKGRKFT